MPFDDLRAALFALLSQPVVVAAVVLLTGVHAAIWLLVFERVGFPPVLASLMLVPPLTFLLPLYVALARWPSQRIARFPKRSRNTRTRSLQRVVQRQHFARPVLGTPSHHGPLRLAADGLPRVRIPLLPSPPATSWPASFGAESRYLAP